MGPCRNSDAFEDVVDEVKHMSLPLVCFDFVSQEEAKSTILFALSISSLSFVKIITFLA